MDNKLPVYNNVLLIAGTGRDSGKTTFVCSVCTNMPAPKKPISIKVSNHFHEHAGAACLVSASGYKIFEETEVSSDKDTARMLAAGASRVFFLETEEMSAFNAFQKVLSFIPPHTPIICESGGLRNYLIPAVFILLHTKGNEPKAKAKPLIPMADLYIESDMGNLQIPENIVSFENQKWQMNI